MDYTGKYITMCKGAKKLQDNVKEIMPKPYGILYINNDNKVSLLKANSVALMVGQGNYTWLPRVDELIGIMGWVGDDVINKFQYELNDKVNFPYITTFNTLEKMLLCIVMFHKYGEEWNEEELKWIPVKMYGIGTNHGKDEREDDNSWGMIAGATRDINEMLNHPMHPEALKDTEDWYIINLVTNKTIYKWNIVDSKWESIT